MAAPTRELSGWGNYPRAQCRVRSPETLGAARAAVGDNTIARGLGRSYGDPSINEGGLVLDCTGLDRLLDFDPATGTLVCEAGVSLKQIIDTFTPRGFFPAITPGTKHVTVGGCIANDVHGKAHHVDGCFSNCVDSFTVLVADGRVVTASRDENADSFWASFGGMGLLGVILTATIRLRPVETAFFRQEAVPVSDLDGLLDAFETYDARYPYSVAWVDPLATGASIGRGVLTVGDHATLADLPARLRDEPRVVTSPSPIRVPFDMPAWALNTSTIRVLNVAIDQVQRHGGAVAHYEKFFYPLDAIQEWNRGYGRPGFTQYQFVIPLEDGPRRIRDLLSTIATSGQAPFLDVLKKFGPGNPLAPLSFPFEGYTFAIDFPVRAGLAELLRVLDEKVLDAGGRVYLGKDAFMDAATFERMYPGLPTWREAKRRWDPDERFRSNLSRRVGLTSK